MATQERTKTHGCRMAKMIVVSICCTVLSPLDQPIAAAQALLYDNSHLEHHGTPKGTIWLGPQFPGDWFFAQPFKMGAHDNISSVSIPMMRSVRQRNVSGNFAVAIWDDNGDGFPGQEVAVLGKMDVTSLTTHDFGTPVDNPAHISFDTPVDNLTPGKTYFIVIDNRELDSFNSGVQLWALANTREGTNGVGGQAWWVQ